jgi:cytochrome c
MRKSIVVLSLIMLLAAGCDIALLPPLTAPDATVSGDPVRGEQIFRQGINSAPPCISCHQVTTGPGFGLGPSLAGVASRAGSRIDGLNAAEYLYQSITDPSVFLAPGYRELMYTNYGTDLSEQDIADLIAFLETLE